MKYCSKCKLRMEQDLIFCPICGKKLNNNIVKKREILRYIFGGFLCLSGISNIIQKNYFGIINILFGISLFPFIYKKYIFKITKNYKITKNLQLLLPITFLILLIILTNNNQHTPKYNTQILKEETIEEKALRIVEENIYPSHQTIDKKEINLQTGNYDFKIKENENGLNEYTCASNAQFLVKQIIGIEKIGSIEFECISNNQTFYYVLIDNINSLSSNKINENTKFYDNNHNIVNTNIDILKENSINEYKKSCNSYNYKDVLRNPDIYEKKHAYWFGKIVQVIDKNSYYSTFRIDVTCENYTYSNDYYCDDTIYVNYYGEESFIENDMIKMWGTMDGTQTYTTVLGANMTVPKFNAIYMELLQ